jgi:hypothetical protein
VMLRSFTPSRHFYDIWHQHCSIVRGHKTFWSFFLDKKRQEALSSIFNIAK